MQPNDAKTVASKKTTRAQPAATPAAIEGPVALGEINERSPSPSQSDFFAAKLAELFSKPSLHKSESAPGDVAKSSRKQMDETVATSSKTTKPRKRLPTVVVEARTTRSMAKKQK
jgi:hypothetical protein